MSYKSLVQVINYWVFKQDNKMPMPCNDLVADKLNAAIPNTSTHIDDWIDYGPVNYHKLTESEQDEINYARWFLFYKRSPATLQMAFAKAMREHKLFCDYEGVRYRCTGASRLGDVWLTSDLNQDYGYERRVEVLKCSNWGKTAYTLS